MRRTSRPKPPAGTPYEAGLRYLGRRAHSRAELRRKLLRRGHAEDEIEDAIARLAAQGYIDDAAFAEGHVHRRSASRGPLALAMELAERGVDRDVARGALAGLDREAQLAAAVRLAHRQVGRKRPAGYQELLNTVGAGLLRRGFGQAVAREACRAVWLGTVGQAEA